MMRRTARFALPALLLLLVGGCARRGKQDAPAPSPAAAPTAAADLATPPADPATAPPPDATNAGPQASTDAASAGPASYPPPSPDDRADSGVTPPDLVETWLAADAPRTYLPDDLHLLVDGGDEVFFRYGFAWAVRRTYRTERPTNRRVRVEVHAFSSPAGAVGRYDHESMEAGEAPWSATPPPPDLVGAVDAARLDADQLRLARGRFLAILRYEDDAEADPKKLIADAREPLLSFASELGGLLGREGTTDEHR